MSNRHTRARWTRGIPLCAALWLSGCAIHYYDADSGTEHIWGFGHLKMRAPPADEGVRAIATETEVLGVGVGVKDASLWGLVGWNRDSRVTIVDDDTSVRFDWPTNRLFDVRVGSEPPFAQPASSTPASRDGSTDEPSIDTEEGNP